MYWYLAVPVVFPIIYKQGDFEVATYIDAKLEANPENINSTSSYVVMLANESNSFKGVLESITAQSNMEAKLVAAAAIVTTESVSVHSNMMMELDFKEGFESVLVSIDNTSVLHMAENRLVSSSAKHITPRYFLVIGTRHAEDAKEAKIAIHYVWRERQNVKLGTRRLKNHGHRLLTKLINIFKAHARGVFA